MTDKETRRKHVESVLGSDRLEGHAPPDPTELELYEKYIDGEMSADEIYKQFVADIRNEKQGTGNILLSQGQWVAYTDESLGEGIFREYPDGRIEKIDYQNGSFKVLEVVRESTK